MLSVVIKNHRTNIRENRKSLLSYVYTFLLASRAKAIMMMTLVEERSRKGGGGGESLSRKRAAHFVSFFATASFEERRASERAGNSRLIGRNEIFPAIIQMGPMTNALRNIFRYGRFIGVIKRGSFLYLPLPLGHRRLPILTRTKVNYRASTCILKHIPFDV